MYNDLSDTKNTERHNTQVDLIKSSLNKFKKELKMYLKMRSKMKNHMKQ